MKYLVMCLMTLSLGLFSVGCSPATEESTPPAAPAAPATGAEDAGADPAAPADAPAEN